MEPWRLFILSIVIILGSAGYGMLIHTKSRRTKKGSSRHWEILRMQRAHPSWRTVTPTLKELYRYLETHNPGEYAKPKK